MLCGCSLCYVCMMYTYVWYEVYACSVHSICCFCMVYNICMVYVSCVCSVYVYMVWYSVYGMHCVCVVCVLCVCHVYDIYMSLWYSTFMCGV